MKKSKDILIIDDSFTNNVLVEAVLEGEGYKISKAFTVSEALRILKEKQFDLILLDLIMPRKNGYDFLKSVRKNNNTTETPIMVVSAVTNPDKINKTFDLGAVDYISKPIDIEEFISKVGSLLEKRMVN